MEKVVVNKKVLLQWLNVDRNTMQSTNQEFDQVRIDIDDSGLKVHADRGSFKISPSDECNVTLEFQLEAIQRGGKNG